ncbi:hypothetical protein AtEden1_Chr1g0060841 [Arabidopsis thaliana]
MAITQKPLIAFVFSVIFLISYVHCQTTIANAPRGEPTYTRGRRRPIPVLETCFRTTACFDEGSIGCLVYCKEAHYDYGICIPQRCCCYRKDKTVSEVK